KRTRPRDPVTGSRSRHSQLDHLLRRPAAPVAPEVTCSVAIESGRRCEVFPAGSAATAVGGARNHWVNPRAILLDSVVGDGAHVSSSSGRLAFVRASTHASSSSERQALERSLSLIAPGKRPLAIMA